MPKYRLARDPAVILDSAVCADTTDMRGFALGVTVAADGRGRALGVVKDGVTRPAACAGVVRPLAENAGVVRPVTEARPVMEARPVTEARPLIDGVIRPLACGRDGVARPREDVTEGGRKMGAESFADATKTPHFGGHEKYDTLHG